MLGEAEQRPYFIVSGLTPEEHQGLWEMPQGLGFFEYLSELTTPLRLANIIGYLSALGMGEFTPPIPVSSLLVAPMRQQGTSVGTIYLAHEAEGREFGQEDEETLVMFAAQAAQVIANARRHREERRGQGRPGDVGQHLPGGRGSLRRRHGDAHPSSTGRRYGSWRGSGIPDRGAEHLLEVLTFRRGRRPGGLPQGVSGGAGVELGGRRCGPRRS